MVVPGLTVGQSVGYAQPHIRGVGTLAAGPGVENSVATYIDNVYLASPFAGSMLFNNISQLAVLKGPQGTLFGRNATGGVIQITTYDPDQGPSVKASATYGNHNTFGGDAYIAGKLAESASLGVSGFYTKQVDGYGTNFFTGNDVGNYETFGLRSKLKLDLGGTTVRLSADYARKKGNLFGYHVAKGTLPASGVPYVGPDYSEDLTIDNSQKIKSGGVSLQIDQQIGSLTLASITAWRKAVIDEIFDTDAQRAPITVVSLKQVDRQFSQEFQLLSPRDERFEWMVGAFYFDANSSYPFQRPVLRSPPFTGPPTIINNSATQTTKSYAGFGQMSFALASQTKFTAGLRYTSDKRGISNRRQVTNPAGVTFPATNASAQKTFNKLTWRLSVDHRFSDNLMAYASYNRGFKSGLFEPVTQPIVMLQPEVMDAYEIGFKADLFDRAVRINGAVFHYDIENIQILRVVNGQVLLQNGEGADVDGIDLDATIRPSENLTLTAGWTYANHRFTQFPDAPKSTPLPAGGNLIGTGDAQGNRLAMSPVWAVNLGATYVIPTDIGDFTLNASYFHNDGYFEGPENRFRQKPFDLVNASAGWSSGKWRASVWAKNLFNEFYSTQLTSRATGDSFVLGDPQTYGITVGFSF